MCLCVREHIPTVNEHVSYKPVVEIT